LRKTIFWIALFTLLISVFLIESCSNPFWPGLDGTLTKNNGKSAALVRSVSVEITAPAKGSSPNTEATDLADSGEYICGEVLWTADTNEWIPGSQFLGGTVYSSHVTLTANDNFTFKGIDDNAIEINGLPADVTANTGGTITLSFEFDKTLEHTLTGITITNPPKTAYIHGQDLDLTELEVTLAFDDHSDESVPFDKFGTNITTNLTNGKKLVHISDDGLPVMVFFGEIEATPVYYLSVNQKKITVADIEVDDKIYDGTVNAAGTASLSETVAVDDVKLEAGNIAFTDSNAGINKLVILDNGWVLSGKDADNYSLCIDLYYETTASITPAALGLALSGVSAFSPIDDTVGIVINGLIGDDQVNLDLDLITDGFKFDSDKFTLAFTDNIEFAKTSVDIEFSVTDFDEKNYAIADTIVLAVDILDGRTTDRRIPVTQTNIIRFNNYASDTGLARHYILSDPEVTLAEPDSPNESNWTSIGNDKEPFKGSFNGNGNKISNLIINNPTSDYQGMFGYISTGIVEKLGLSGGSITGKQYVGGIAGYSNGATVQNCFTTGTVTGNNQVGGIVGYNNSAIVSSCYTTGNIRATVTNSIVGGIVGSNIAAAKVTDCYSTGNVVLTNDNDTGSAGGIAGYNFKAEVQNCYASGGVTTGDSPTNVNNAGGIVGHTSGNVINNVALNKIISTTSAYSKAGRIVGLADNGAIMGKNYYVGDVKVFRKNGEKITYVGTGTDYTDNNYVAVYDGYSISNNNWLNANGINWNTSSWDFSTIWQWDNTVNPVNPPTLRNMPK